MSYKVKYPSSTMNIGGVLVQIFLHEWAPYCLTGDELNEFRNDMDQIGGIIDSKVADGSFVITEKYQEDYNLMLVESQHPIDNYIHMVLLKWEKRMQQDPLVITYRNIEIL